MKTLLSFTAAAFAVGSAFGQGQVLFQNYDKSASPSILAPVYWGTLGGGYGPPISGSNARAALLGGPLPYQPWDYNTFGELTALASPVTGQTWVNFRTGAAAGYVDVGTDSPRVVPTVPYGGQALLQMVVWTGNYDSWTDAWNAWRGNAGNQIGISQPWAVTTTLSFIDMNFPRNLGLESFSTLVVPEPSVQAIAGLGGLVLVLSRLSKRQRAPKGTCHHLSHSSRCWRTKSSSFRCG
jgi:hypothetical protein